MKGDRLAGENIMTETPPVPSYLFYYIYRHLNTPVRLFGPDRRLILEHVFPDFSDEICFPQVMEAAYPTFKDRLSVFSIEQAVFYAWIPLKGCIAVIGPVRFSEGYASHHCISLSGMEDVTEASFQEWCPHVWEADFQDFTECVLLLANCTPGKAPDPAKARRQLLTEHFLPEDTDEMNMISLSRLLFDKRESNFVHNPYNHELREVGAVERGDTEELDGIIHEDYSGRYGTLSSDPLRQEIDMGIVVVTLTSRAAIRGGLSPEAAFYLSDNYIQALEKCTTPLSAKHTAQRAEMHYARLVREMKQDRPGVGGEENPHISRCKDYVYSHLHRKLQVQDIASAIGLEPNYLSALFKKYEQVTLKQYIMNAKIRLVQNLLTYSDYSCIEIASYLGFTSQSHMGESFRRVTGMTPKKYREKYRKEDFLNEYK